MAEDEEQIQAEAPSKEELQDAAEEEFAQVRSPPASQSTPIRTRSSDLSDAGLSLGGARNGSNLSWRSPSVMS